MNRFHFIKLSFLYFLYTISITYGFEFYVGVSDLSNNSNVIKWINNTWMDGLSIGYPPTYTISDLIKLTDMNIRLLPCIHGNIETFQRQLLDHNIMDDIQPYTLAYTTILNDFINITINSSRPMWWWTFIEDDSSGVAFPYNQLSVKPSSVTDAFIQWNMYLTRSLVLINSLSNLISTLPKVAQVGFGEYSHSYALRNIDLILIERANDDIGDLNTAIAFARGAARQYGISWGIDLSWWWGVVYSGVNNMPASYHRRHAILSYFSGAYAINIEGGDGLIDSTGTTPTILGKEMENFGIFVKTHQLNRIHYKKQNKNLLFQKKQKFTINNENRYNNFHKPFYQKSSVLQLGDNAGEVLTTCLIILPLDHGYQTRPYWQTQSTAAGYAHLPPRQGDAGISSFFSHIFPGSNFVQDAFPFGSYTSNDPPASPFAESAITSRYAPTSNDVFTAAPPIPFGTFNNRTDAAVYFSNGNIDPAPYRPMADSTYGDIFDVAVAGLGLSSMSSTSGIQPNNVLQSSTNKKLNHYYSINKLNNNSNIIPSLTNYKLSILLGPVNLTMELKLELIEYVKNGGTIIIPAGIVGPNDNDLIGITILPELRTGRIWTWINEQNNNNIIEPYRYTPLSINNNCTNSINCTILAINPQNNAPLVIRNTIGLGNVITCLIPWFIGSQNTLSKLSLYLFDKFIIPVQPIYIVDSLGPVDYVSMYDDQTEKFTTTISNNDENEWNGTVLLNTIMYNQQWKNCFDIYNGKDINTNGTSFTISVNSFDVAVIECDIF